MLLGLSSARRQTRALCSARGVPALREPRQLTRAGLGASSWPPPAGRLRWLLLHAPGHAAQLPHRLEPGQLGGDAAAGERPAGDVHERRRERVQCAGGPAPRSPPGRCTSQATGRRPRSPSTSRCRGSAPGSRRRRCGCSSATAAGGSAGPRRRSTRRCRPATGWRWRRSGRPGPRSSAPAAAPLTRTRPIVTVGLVGSRIKDAAAVSDDLLAAGAPSRDHPALGRQGAPSYFEPVFQISRPASSSSRPSPAPTTSTRCPAPVRAVPRRAARSPRSSPPTWSGRSARSPPSS